VRALVVGADGFAGRWLVRHLSDSGDTVAAAVGPRFSPPLDAAATIRPIDVRDETSLTRFIAESEPQAIYYLAGVSQRGSRDTVSAAAGVSVVGGVNTLIGAAGLGSGVRMLFVSSGYIYRDTDSPLGEEGPTRPTSIYASAKLAAEDALRRLAPPSGVELIIARPFNHIGPGQRGSFVVPTVVQQVRDVADGRSSAIRVGPVDSVRDFSDVRDVVRAYRVLATEGRAGETYNVASGTGTVIRDLIDMIMEIAGVSAEVISSQPAAGDNQPRSLIGDARKLIALGWRPTFSLRQTVADTLQEQPVR
jgi:GDP-4-dehydro-6-deoxy-D-mannose reductase